MKSLEMESTRKNFLAGKNEVLLKNEGDWLHFCRPYQIISVHTRGEVPISLQRVEDLVNRQGWHAAGFLSYEAAAAFDPALQTHALEGPTGNAAASNASRSKFPYMWFGLYPEPRVVALPKLSHPAEALDWQPATGIDCYRAALDQIREHIGNGRTYQVNYTFPLWAKFTADPWDFFVQLTKSQNSHAAYLDIGEYVICSASPELFFQLDGETITCRPMKGTVKRGRTTAEDREQSEWLLNSAKNRAENVMIVDMLRNDLGRIAETGSVRVPRLFETERYPTLWQMTSTVTARTTASLPEILRALFPCASITGAPKISAMKIIASLEKSPRRIYTGCIGYLAPLRKATFNVAIRTALIDRVDQQIEYGVGGGIVWDSTAGDEYAESLLKSRILAKPVPEFSLLESLLWTPADKFILRERHLTRMLDSADYFDIPLSKRNLDEFLDQLSSDFNDARQVRVLADRAGKLTFEAAPFRPGVDGRLLEVRLADRAVDSGNVFLYHKSTRRGEFEAARADHPDADDVLLYNEQGELTEFTIGNLVVEWGTRLLTPPIRCGLLAGTFRAHLLDAGEIAEETIRVEDLPEGTKIFRINSVRGWQAARLQG